MRDDRSQPIDAGDAAALREQLLGELFGAIAGELTRAEADVLLIFLRHANRSAITRVGVKRVARELGLSDLKNVRRVRDMLVRKRFLEFLSSETAAPNAYRLCISTPAAARLTASEPIEMPLPLFEPAAVALARAGLPVVIDRDSRVAHVGRRESRE